MKPIIIEDHVVELIKFEAQNTYNEECCGFLFGNDENENRRILSALPVDNKQEDGRRKFLIDPLDYMKAEEKAEKGGVKLLGVYHSHPDCDPIPSEHDLSQALPFFSYIIVSVFQGKVKELRSWQLNENNEFEEEQFDNKQGVTGKFESSTL